MKKVKFIKKIKAIYLRDGEEVNYRSHNQVELPLKKGTGIDVEVEGLFIDWGLDTDERMGSWTVAIIQLQDGSIELVHPELSNMKFIADSCGVEIKHDKEQDELTISNQPYEISTAAFAKDVSELSIHIAKHLAGKNRKLVYDWIDKFKGKEVTLIIE